METKELIQAYKVIKWAATQNTRASYNQAFVTVQNWLANKICDELEDGQIFNK